MEKFKKILGKVKEFTIKNWKIIVVCFCAMLLLGQCSSCNRDNRVERKDKEITQLKTQQDSLQSEYNHLRERFEDSQNHNSDFSNIAQGNQTVLVNKIDSLNNVVTTQNKTISELQGNVRALQTLNNELTIANDALHKDNIRLNAEAVDLMTRLNNK